MNIFNSSRSPFLVMREEKVSISPISVQPCSAVCPNRLACSRQVHMWKCTMQVIFCFQGLLQAHQRLFCLPSEWTPLLTRIHHSCLPTTNVQGIPILETYEKCTSELPFKCFAWTYVLTPFTCMYVCMYVHLKCFPLPKKIFKATFL